MERELVEKERLLREVIAKQQEVSLSLFSRLNLVTLIQHFRKTHLSDLMLFSDGRKTDVADIA